MREPFLNQGKNTSSANGENPPIGNAWGGGGTLRPVGRLGKDVFQANLPFSGQEQQSRHPPFSWWGHTLANEFGGILVKFLLGNPIIQRFLVRENSVFNGE